MGNTLCTPTPQRAEPEPAKHPSPTLQRTQLRTQLRAAPISAMVGPKPAQKGSGKKGKASSAGKGSQASKVSAEWRGYGAGPQPGVPLGG